MSCFDSFYNKNNYEIQVKLYDAVVGGTLTTYRIGDKVPAAQIGLDFKEAKFYGENYNIFPYMTDDYVIIIRNGVFIDAIYYKEMKDDYVFDIQCYDKYGNKLNFQSAREYIILKEVFSS